jgi:hypothetical protein
MPGSARYNRRSLEPRRVALLPQPMKFKGEIATPRLSRRAEKECRFGQH